MKGWRKLNKLEKTRSRVSFVKFEVTVWHPSGNNNLASGYMSQVQEKGVLNITFGVISIWMVSNALI